MFAIYVSCSLFLYIVVPSIYSTICWFHDALCCFDVIISMFLHFFHSFYTYFLPCACFAYHVKIMCVYVNSFFQFCLFLFLFQSSFYVVDLIHEYVYA